MKVKILILFYLAAIVGANLLAQAFGPWATPLIGFFAIGFDLTARCVLQEAWAKRRWKRNMFWLIVAGSLLTLAVNRHAWNIALASTVAFAVSETLDATLYTACRKAGITLLTRVNFANFFSALVDSILFSYIAFHVIMPQVIAAEHAAKFIGGFVWSLVLKNLLTKEKYV